MTMFTIDHDNNITAFASATEAKSNAETERFRSVKELPKLTAKWPATRLIEIWNSLPGVSPVRKFTSRPMRGRPNVPPRLRDPADGSKTAMVLELLRRPRGATLNELMAATEWQAHSVRGFLSGTLRKKMGLKTESDKSAEQERTYSMRPEEPNSCFAHAGRTY